MNLYKLHLNNFRNYERLELDLPAKVNIFVGDNAQGKTNVLESIYTLALTKSHRTAKDRELIRWGQSVGRVYAEMEKKHGPGKLEILFADQGKKVRINGVEQRRLSDYVGYLNVVMFAPEDLDLVKGSPAVRRRFLDMELAQVQPSYLHHLQQYNKILAQRNRLLKQMADQPDEKRKTLLDIWNGQLANHGSKIVTRRQHFIHKLQRWAEKIHADITDGKEKLAIRYETSLDLQQIQDEAMLMELFMVKLSYVQDQEIKRGATLVGPHRDDLVFFINGKEVGAFGSQGQQRTTALSLKLAEIELIHEETGEYPVLLLDDVLSELDANRQTRLIETFQNVQTFITATGIEQVLLNRLQDVCVYRVQEGRIRMMENG